MRLLLILLISWGVAACDREEAKRPTPTTTAKPEPKPALPEEVLLAYYDAMAQGNLAEAYAMVNESDRAARTLEQFTTSASDPLQLAIIKQRKYVVKDTVVTADTARVVVDTTGPDIASLKKYVVRKHLSENPETPDAEGLKALMLEAVQRPGGPTVVMTQTLFLLRDASGEWKLDFDWDKPHPGRGVPLQERPAPQSEPATDAGAD